MNEMRINTEKFKIHLKGELNSKVQPQPYAAAPPPQTGYIYGYGQVVTSQPVGGSTAAVQQQPTQLPERKWHTGLFNITSDISICLRGAFLGPCLLRKTTKAMGEPPCVLDCPINPLAELRSKWRAQNNIEGSTTHDCLQGTCCFCCALCQLARDVKIVQKAGTGH
ncbi:placenta-specific gene 8 protein-like [Plakobranchus ocellatus]|uniref:Placenta-specific gene 8 protein-like n=1 Tax=Plakobranchus ocellatus TaxID=259542 RepID=A0AAV4AAW1_9GAST|nr:placenta-specific gene 8 protein-like [Plakobranchus ocellatus]